uniref:Uncharacterized protein n=1 Tax=Rhizophora mucronata TaxID=61149 RepID=A0A2P2PMV1_RHIMU
MKFEGPFEWLLDKNGELGSLSLVLPSLFLVIVGPTCLKLLDCGPSKLELRKWALH